MDKTSTIEYIENIYGLATNYLKNHNNSLLNELMNELEEVEAKFKSCDDMLALLGYEKKLKDLVDRMEVIINE